MRDALPGYLGQLEGPLGACSVISWMRLFSSRMTSARFWRKRSILLALPTAIGVWRLTALVARARTTAKTKPSWSSKLSHMAPCSLRVWSHARRRPDGAFSSHSRPTEPSRKGGFHCSDGVFQESFLCDHCKVVQGGKQIYGLFRFRASSGLDLRPIPRPA